VVVTVTMKNALEAQQAHLEDPANEKLSAQHERRVTELAELLKAEAGYTSMTAQMVEVGDASPTSGSGVLSGSACMGTHRGSPG
jgi:hypothetical protein